jgi:hypothetical protein
VYRGAKRIVDAGDYPRRALPDVEDVRLAVARLAPRDRQVILFKFVLDATDDQIADCFQVTRARTWQLKKRALDRLRALLMEERDGGEGSGTDGVDESRPRARGAHGRPEAHGARVGQEVPAAAIASAHHGR